MTLLSLFAPTGCAPGVATGRDAASESDGGSTMADAAGPTRSADASTPVACTYYADPILGDPANSGTSDSPWGGLESILATSPTTLRGGDVVCLRPGNHGAPRGKDLNFVSDVTFFAIGEDAARVSQIKLEGSSYMVFDGLLVDGAGSINPNLDEKERALVEGDVATHHIVLRRLTIRSATDISAWTKTDWYRLSKGGIDMRGPFITAERNQIRNTYHALSLRGDSSRAAYNIIDNFAGDGIRGLGSFSVYEFNTVRDAYVNDYAIQHDDGFQAFSRAADPKIESVVIRNNRFIQFLDPITPFISDNDLIGTLMQGIIITDGYADGWTVENNVVVVNHFHGITLNGARGCRVQNNTVVQSPMYTDSDVPWISLVDQVKTGQKNFNNIIRNNLAAKFTTWTFDSTSTAENNTDINELDREDYRRFFADYDAQDFRLRAGSPAINAGVNTDISDFDIDGNERLRGGTVDTGAFEYQADLNH